MCYLSQYFLERMKKSLTGNQKFVTAGGFNNELEDRAMYVQSNTSPQIENTLQCNAEELDTRIWLHTEANTGSRH